MEIPTSQFLAYLKEEGFVRFSGDSFNQVYTRGKITIVIDPENPTFDIAFLRHDMTRQRDLENAVTDRFFDRLDRFLKGYGKEGNED